MAEGLEAALAAIPDSHRQPLLNLYAEALDEYRAGRWENVGVKAGKLCEVTYSVIRGYVDGSYPAKPTKPANMVRDCLKLEELNKKHGRSLCIQIPRVLVAAYEMRNNRDIGHVGSDVDPNHMDAEFLLRTVKWIIAELVRVFSEVSAEESREIIESVTERTNHAVWSDGDIRRVLNPALGASSKALILLYSNGGRASVDELCRWAEYGNKTRFRDAILAKLHREALIHLDKKAGTVTMLPPGTKKVEREGLLKAQS